MPNNWTKELTDELFALCRQLLSCSPLMCRYDLRWPIIMDRFHAKQFSLEDCQMVFLDVTKTVLECRRRHGKELTENEEQTIEYKLFPCRVVTPRYDYENSVRRRKQQDLMFRSLCQSQQEEKQLQAKLKSLNEQLAIIGSVVRGSGSEHQPDNRRCYGPRIPVTQMRAMIDEALSACCCLR